jgi:hypothetical protein
MGWLEKKGQYCGYVSKPESQEITWRSSKKSGLRISRCPGEAKKIGPAPQTLTVLGKPA